MREGRAREDRQFGQGVVEVKTVSALGHFVTVRG